MSLQKLNHTYLLKRGKEDTLFEQNPLLARGEPIVIYFNDGTTGLKIGDGINAYNDLPLISGKASEIDFSQVEYLTFNEYTQLTSLEENILYVCTDTQQIFVGTNELTKSSYILEEIPTEETIGNNGSLYYCTKDLSLYLCNKVEDSYIWTIVASMNVDNNKIISEENESLLFTYNAKDKNEPIILKDFTINDLTVADTTMPKVGIMCMSNKNLYGGDCVSLFINGLFNSLCNEIDLVDYIVIKNNKLCIDTETFNAHITEGIIPLKSVFDTNLRKYKYLMSEVSTPAVNDIIYNDARIYFTEDLEGIIEGFSAGFMESSSDPMPLTIFGKYPKIDGEDYFPSKDGDGDDAYIYFSGIEAIGLPNFNYCMDLYNFTNLNSSNFNPFETNTYKHMKRIMDIDNKSEDTIIYIRLNDCIKLFNMSPDGEPTIVPSEYEKQISQGLTDIDESLKNIYHITYKEFKNNLYLIALVPKGDVVYGYKPKDSEDEYITTQVIEENDSQLITYKPTYHQFVEVTKINGVNLTQEEKDTITMDYMGVISAKEGKELPSSIVKGASITYKYKIEYINPLMTKGLSIQIADNNFVDTDNKIYCSEIISSEVPNKDEPLEQLINDEGSIILESLADGENYITFQNIETRVSKNLSIFTKLEKDTRKIVKETIDSITKLTGTVNLENIFEPGTYLIEADNILGAPDNYVNNLISNKKEFINGNTGEITSADVVISAFMKVTEHPIDVGSGIYSLEEADDGKIYVRHINTTTLELPLHTYKLNRVVFREADNPSNMIYDPEDSWNDSLFFGKWVHDDDTKYGPNLLLDENKYIKQLNMVEEAVLTSDDITLDMMLFNPSNTSIVKFDILEKMLDKCTKEFNYFPSVEHCTTYSDNNLYLPVGSNSLVEYWQSHTISDKKAYKQHPINLPFLNDDIGQKFYVFRELNGRPGLYSTIDCKRFYKILDFDINREVKFSKILIDNADSDISEILDSDYYKTLCNFAFNRLIIEGYIKYIGGNDYYSYNDVPNVDYIIPESSSNMLFYLKNNKLEIIPELDLDNGMLINAPQYYYDSDLGRYVNDYIPLGIGYNEGKVELIDLINNKSTILFQFDSSRYNKVTFIPERLGYFKLICSNLSNNDLVTSDFTETTFTFNTQKMLDIIGVGNSSYRKIVDVSKFSTPYNPDSLIDEFLINKVTLTLNDFKDLTDEHKTILLNHSSQSDTKYLSSSNSSTKFLDMPYWYVGYGKTYGSRIICLQDRDAINTGATPQKLVYIFRDFVIIKDEYGNYLEYITVKQPISKIYQNNFTLTCFTDISSPPTRVLQYVSTNAKAYETINGESVLVYPHTIDTNVVTQDFLIEDQIFNKDYNNSYCKYLLDYKEPEGERIQFNGIMGTKNSPLYVPTTNINNITKFVLTPNELCRDKDNNVVANPPNYNYSDNYNTYNNPLFMIPLNSLNLSDGNIDNKLAFKSGTEIDLINGKIRNAYNRTSLLEYLNISKEQYIELVNDISELTYDYASINGSLWYNRNNYVYAKVPNKFNVTSYYGYRYPIEFQSHNVYLGAQLHYECNYWDSTRNGLFISVDENEVIFWGIENGIIGYNRTIEEIKNMFLTLVEDGNECEIYSDVTVADVYIKSINLNNPISASYYNDLQFNYNIELINDRDINIYDTLLKSSNWLDNPSDTGKFKDMGYNYLYNISVSNVSKDLDIISEVKYSNIEDNIKDNLSKFGLVTSNDKITLYAKEKPIEDVVVRKIKITYR